MPALHGVAVLCPVAAGEGDTVGLFFVFDSLCRPCVVVGFLVRATAALHCAAVRVTQLSTAAAAASVRGPTDLDVELQELDTLLVVDQGAAFSCCCAAAVLFRLLQSARRRPRLSARAVRPGLARARGA